VLSLFTQCAWTIVLCLSGSYNELLDYVMHKIPRGKRPPGRVDSGSELGSERLAR